MVGPTRRLARVQSAPHGVSRMKKVLVLGGGKVGKSVAGLLLACGRGSYSVTLADRDDASLREAQANLARIQKLLPFKAEFTTKKLDASDRTAVKAAMTGHDYVICMLPF